MKTMLLKIALLTFILIPGALCAQNKAKGEEWLPVSLPFAPTLPRFELEDLWGRHYTSEDFKHGVVLINPSLAPADQRTRNRWKQYLLRSKGKNPGQLVMLEDLKLNRTQWRGFKAFKQEYAPSRHIILLVDKGNKLRELLKVEAAQAAVLAYNGEGTLVYAEAEKPALEKAAAIWQSLRSAP